VIGGLDHPGAGKDVSPGAFEQARALIRIVPESVEPVADCGKLAGYLVQPAGD